MPEIISDMDASGDASFTGVEQSLFFSSGIGRLGRIITAYGVNQYFHSYFRFQVNIVKSTITSAFLRLYRYDNRNYNYTNPPVKVEVYIQNIANSVKPTTWSEANTNMGNATSDLVTMELTPPPAQNEAYIEINLKAHIQSIVNHASWVTGNYVGIYIKTIDGLCEINHYTPSIGVTYLPKLSINYNLNTPMPGSYDKSVVDTMDVIQFYTVIDLSVAYQDVVEVVQTITTRKEKYIEVNDYVEFSETFRELRTLTIDYVDGLPIEDTTDISHYYIFAKTVNDDLSVTDYIEVNKPKSKQVYDIVEVNQDITVNPTYFVDYIDDIDILDTITNDRHFRNYVDTLLVVQTVSKNNLLRILKQNQQTIDVTQTITVNRALTNKSVEDVMSVTDVRGRFE